jgi:hypothetical protein
LAKALDTERTEILEGAEKKSCLAVDDRNVGRGRCERQQAGTGFVVTRFMSVRR